MRSAITISLVPETKGGPFVFSQGLVDGCEQAAALGFDAVEIFPSGPDAINSSSLTTLLDRHRLQVAAIGTGAGWVLRKLTLTHEEPAVREDAKEFIRSLVEAGGCFRAPAIIGSMQGRWEGRVTREQ